jgi:hypothetical protein
MAVNARASILFLQQRNIDIADEASRRLSILVSMPCQCFALAGSWSEHFPFAYPPMPGVWPTRPSISALAPALWQAGDAASLF